MKNVKRGTPLYMKAVVGFLVILVVILLLISVVVNVYCMSFIKKQRIQYNTQMLEQSQYEFKKLYIQMNQLLTALSGETISEKVGDVYQQIKEELEFEERITADIYQNGFYDLIAGVLVYENDGQYRYVGSGVAKSSYEFTEDPCFANFPERITDCAVVGPMLENYKAENVEKEKVIGFLKRKVGQQEEGSLPPFVMVTVKFSTIEEILDRMLSANTGYFLTDAEGVTLKSFQKEEFQWDTKDLDQDLKQIAQSGEKNQTLSRNGFLLTSLSLPEYGWYLSVADEESALFQDINQMAILVESMIAVCGTAGLAAALFMSRKVFFPMELLKKLVKEITESGHSYLDGEQEYGDEVEETRGLLTGMKKKIEELNARQYISEVREREAEIRMLQSQINPHFLHNTLDNIYCIAQIEEIEPIEVLTKNLSEMMRYSVNNKSMYVPLEAELKHVKSYVDIINVRYVDCISLELDIEEEAKHAQVVKLLLQPLAENACVHGILKKAEQRGTIRISACRREDVLRIQVEDDGVGVQKEIQEHMNQVFRQEVRSIRTPKNKGFGIALVNVNDRIRLLDGNEYGIWMEGGEKGGTKVTVMQKYRRFQKES